MSNTEIFMGLTQDSDDSNSNNNSINLWEKDAQYDTYGLDDNKNDFERMAL